MEAASDASTKRFKLFVVESDTEYLKTSYFLHIKINRIVTVTVPVIFSILLFISVVLHIVLFAKKETKCPECPECHECPECSTESK